MFSVLFLAISKLCLKQNEQNFAIKSKRSTSKPCFSFSFRKPKEATLFFEQEVFRRVLFVFWTKYLIQIFRKKGLFFFLWQWKIAFSFFSQMFNLETSLKVSTEFSNKKTFTQITNNYLVSRCLENSHFGITKMTRWVGLQKELNCSLPN